MGSRRSPAGTADLPHVGRGQLAKGSSGAYPDLPVMVHHGGTRKKGTGFKKEASKHALVISSYSLLHRDYDLFQAVPWAGIVLDEAKISKIHKPRALRRPVR